MKRSGALVDYASSEDEQEQTRPTEQPATKRRKLPALASNLVVSTPVDNPALHQGRLRSNPHVEGQYAAYVYVPVRISRESALGTLLHKAFRRAAEIVPILHFIGDAEKESDERELHISLTRPIYLRAHQREEFRAAIRAVSRKHKQFPASFANFAELTNDERTRTFLTIEIGAGHRELEALCTALAPALRIYRQTEFYDKPRFHVSIAWALMAQPDMKNPEISSPSPQNGDSGPTSPAEQVPTSTIVKDNDARLFVTTSTGFPAVLRFPDQLLSSLETDFGPALRSRHVSAFEAEYICVKIGKDVCRFRLQGE